MAIISCLLTAANLGDVTMNNGTGTVFELVLFRLLVPILAP